MDALICFLSASKPPSHHSAPPTHTPLTTMKTASRTLLILCTLALGLSGCAKKKGDQYGAADFGSFDSDSVYGTPLSSRPDGAAFFGANVSRNVYPPVYFAYDSSELSGGELDKLTTIASGIRSQGKTVIIAGFTDERGTEEYNRSLGERRAQMVRDVLIANGADAAILQTVSFGEEEPAASGSGESAWAKNRRAEFGVVD